MFSWFMDKVCDDRVDLDPSYKVIGEASKFKGNSGYGATLTDRSKHAQTTFAVVKNVHIHLSNPRFKAMEELSPTMCEIEKKKCK